MHLNSVTVIFSYSDAFTFSANLLYISDISLILHSFCTTSSYFFLKFGPQWLFNGPLHCQHVNESPVWRNNNKKTLSFKLVIYLSTCCEFDNDLSIFCLFVIHSRSSSLHSFSILILLNKNKLPLLETFTGGILWYIVSKWRWKYFSVHAALSHRSLVFHNQDPIYYFVYKTYIILKDQRVKQFHFKYAHEYR